jgi:hypothetical protein
MGGDMGVAMGGCCWCHCTQNLQSQFTCQAHVCGAGTITDGCEGHTGVE